jgi:hypothetical protein
MPKPQFPAIVAAALVLASCTPPEPVPPPRFRPNPPYPPQQVDPYGRPADSYGQPTDPYAPNTDTAPPTPPTAPETPTRPGEFPTAKLTVKPNVVISPYEPYNEVDVSDYKPGELARDPYNKKIFRVP